MPTKGNIYTSKLRDPDHHTKALQPDKTQLCCSPPSLQPVNTVLSVVHQSYKGVTVCSITLTLGCPVFQCILHGSKEETKGTWKSKRTIKEGQSVWGSRERQKLEQEAIEKWADGVETKIKRI